MGRKTDLRILKTNQMTKFIDKTKEEKEEVKTVFTHYVNGLDQTLDEAKLQPLEFDIVEYIATTQDECDVFWARNEGKGGGIFLGKKGTEFD